jgi:hypothetical protein
MKILSTYIKYPIIWCFIKIGYICVQYVGYMFPPIFQILEHPWLIHQFVVLLVKLKIICFITVFSICIISFELFSLYIIYIITSILKINLEFDEK